LEAIKQTGHTSSVATYALQCHCPQCEAEGYTYGGRYFKAPDNYDIARLNMAEYEWFNRHNLDLLDFWPKAELWVSYMTHKLNGGIPNWGYTHWWKMFNPRQLMVHALLLKTITEASESGWPLDVREQAIGAFQQYLRNQNMFCFWDHSRDCMVPHMSNANYHPKSLVVENCVFNSLGRGNWLSNTANALEGVEWAIKPWEGILLSDGNAKSMHIDIGDPIIPGNEPYCGSSTDLSIVPTALFDLVITDPPFGNNLFYADLADFFHVWLRLPLRKWYAGLSEASYFEPERTPHSMEAIDNPIEHPDDRNDYEKEPFVESKHLVNIRDITGDPSLNNKDPNPLYRPQPSSDFYSQTLAAVWAEAGRRLKDGGIMAFTFHHNEDSAWVDVLMALFNAGYVLVATYPIRSDETKGDAGAFGSRKIEYDIIHVCRKRLEKTEPVSWARMRRWVKEESKQLKDLLEHTHGKTLPQSDLRVILRGKSLEFYSRHYGQVFTGDNQVLAVRDALLGINQLLDDLLEDTAQDGGLRPPDSAEPASRLYMRLFKRRVAMPRDELSKTLRGSGVAQADLEAKGWVRELNKIIHVVPVKERFTYFTANGRNRKVIKTDLDQAHFLIGAALPGSGIKVEAELNNINFRIKRSVDEILGWMAEIDSDPAIRLAAHTAAQLVVQWRTRKDRPEIIQPTLFDMLEENI
jgi:putative DNA methylase